MFNIINFGNLSLVKRIAILVIFPVILSLIFGFFAFNSLNDNKATLNEISAKSDILLLEQQLLTTIHGQIRNAILDIDSGKLTWSDGLELLTKNKKIIENQFKTYNRLNAADLLNKETVATAAKNSMPEFLASIDDVIKIIETENKAYLRLFILEEMHERMNPLIDAITQSQKNDVESSNEKIASTLDKVATDESIILSLLIFNLFVLLLLGYFVFKSISKQAESLTSTVDELNKGNRKARTTITGDHELSQLGAALNQLLNERDQTERMIQRENETLNDSVFALLESVADLSERNLTVRATVTEDVTGPLADAINQLAIDTTSVLKKVQKIALSVESTSKTVDQHTLKVKGFAELEYAEAQQTSEAVNHLIDRLNQIADASSSANDIASDTTQTTEKAYQSVGKTLDSMTEIRETVQETGKRIKRLGERSQEITHIIDLINTITERTTVLALNASMQALSAGEAGKGFSVIAEEIQRLAESSRESTDQIANLIKNIQQETRTTMTTMDNTIKQVVSGSSLAEEASEQMKLTLEATNKLTQSVESIAQASKEQVEISQNLYVRSAKIIEATQSTGVEMQSLSSLTENMVNDAQELVHSVNVFKLENSEISKARAA